MFNQTGILERRNFRYNVIEGSLWMAGGQFISSQTVLPALVTRLGGSNMEIGLLGMLVYLALFLPQIFSARYAPTLAIKKRWVINLGFFQRVIVLAMGCTIFVFGAGSPRLALWLLLILFTCNQIILGINTPIWFEFLTKLTPLSVRGRLLGMRNSIAGFLSILASFALTYYLTYFSFPVSYSIAFFSTVAIQMIALAFQARIMEEEASPTYPLQPFKEYFRHLLQIVNSNHSFKRFLFASIFLILATMPMGFFTVYAIRDFNADESMVGTFTLLTVAGQIVGALLNGTLADRYGNKLALLSASLSMFIAVFTAMLAPTVEWFTVVFFAMGIFLGSEMMTRYNLAVEYCHAEHRAAYIGIMNTFLAPYYLCGFLGGILSNTWGYHVMFGVGLAFSAIGIVVLQLRVTDPRTELR